MIQNSNIGSYSRYNVQCYAIRYESSLSSLNPMNEYIIYTKSAPKKELSNFYKLQQPTKLLPRVNPLKLM